MSEEQAKWLRSAVDKIIASDGMTVDLDENEFEAWVAAMQVQVGLPLAQMA